MTERCWVVVTRTGTPIAARPTRERAAADAERHGHSMVEMVPADGTVSLTEFERVTLTTFVGLIANDGLDTYGLDGPEKAAVRRALVKLRGGQ